jgi:hypothetical protein
MEKVDADEIIAAQGIDPSIFDSSVTTFMPDGKLSSIPP